MTAGEHILVIGYGNPGRSDDGLGPRAAEQVERAGLPGVRVLTDYQLNVEHAADVAESETVVFIDAVMGADERAFSFRRLLPRRADAFSTHVMRPEAVLALAQEALEWRGRAYLLGIRGCEFGAFAEALSAGARQNLDAAVAFLVDAIRSRELDSVVTDAATDDSDGPCQDGEPCTKAST
ncbi:MAG: hypothetical protein Kow0022_13450 [Phycisphaerales bacterium]